MASNQYRQGHIVLDEIEKMPKSAIRVETVIAGHVVIAHGESGREHVFKSERVSIYQDGSDLFIQIIGDDPVILEHPEHGDFEVAPGTYRLIEQREEVVHRVARASYD